MSTLDFATAYQQDANAGPEEILKADAHGHSVGDACMFCDESVGVAATSEDPLAFRDHLSRNGHCAREYQLWKQVITDEWLGD